MITTQRGAGVSLALHTTSGTLRTVKVMVSVASFCMRSGFSYAFEVARGNHQLTLVWFDYGQRRVGC